MNNLINLFVIIKYEATVAMS